MDDAPIIINEEALTETFVRRARRTQKENRELKETVERMEAFLVDFQKAFAASDDTRSFLQRFEGVANERKQNDLAMKEYAALHPELRLDPEQKISFEKYAKFSKGFAKYQKQKLGEART